jgi:hypothetical protein
VLLVDDDQAEIRKWQEQRRTRAGHHADTALGHLPPHLLAHPRRQLGMPFRRPRPEPVVKPVEKLRVSAISGSRIRTCLPCLTVSAIASK